MEDGWVNQVIIGIALHREGKGVSGEWRGDVGTFRAYINIKECSWERLLRAA